MRHAASAHDIGARVWYTARMREARQNLDPTTSKNLDKLEEKLGELFQLDRGDLDFGLYRIMAMKSAEVRKFLREELLPEAKAVLAKMNEARRLELEAEIARMHTQLIREGISTPSIRENSGRISILRDQQPDLQPDKNAEADVYDHLTKFFERYYSEGDFISQRRYTGGANTAYLIPYDGEEVKLHWANADQYYIKTTKNYASYVFALDGDARRVRFEIVKADNEKDNIKEVNGKQRRFVLAGKSALQGKEAAAVEDGGLVIRFEHRPLNEKEKSKWPGNGSHQQSRINKAIEKRLLKRKKMDPNWLAPLIKAAPTDADSERNVLAKHLARYTTENSFDYFIHKDLGGFLRRELDLYLKNDVLNLDELAEGDFARLHRAHVCMSAIRQVAEKIITFLAQLEDYQKTLWLKKKFVLETQYCVTLDKVPQPLYADIIGNDAQRAEWVALFAIDETNGDLAASGYSEPLTAAFLKENPFLVVDTRHFDRAFTDKLLAGLSKRGGLDEQLDGLLVHGENFQALNLLQARYRGEVKCVYIDPPYNTDAAPMLYKNNYKNSSWMSLMNDRLAFAQNLMLQDSIVCVAIDDEEMSELKSLLDSIFAKQLGVVVVRSNPAGRKTKGKMAPAHEYAFFYGKTEKSVPGSLDVTIKRLARYPQEDAEGRFAWANFIRSGTNDKREDRPKMFYPIFVNDKNEIRIPEMEWDDSAREWVYAAESKLKTETVVYPHRDIGNESVEGCWHRGCRRVLESPSEYRARRSPSGEISIDFKTRLDEDALPVTWWGDSKYASSNYGALELKNLFAEKRFNYAKASKLVEDCVEVASCNSIDAVALDYFAGSGTTGHAVINLNREDDGKRKYILVEIGHHFDDVLLPRIKKAVYSKDWQDGKPCGRAGISQFVKYIRLESYEDTLDNLEVTPPNPEQQEMLAESPELAADYQLRYALSAETAHSASLLGKEFSDPFAYQLSVVQDGVRHAKNADLVETFNLLLGLRVSTRRMLDDVLAITGTDAREHVHLILWRNPATMDGEKLNAWLAAHCAQFPKKLDAVYINGDSALNSVNRPGETWTAQAIEPVFRELMFGGKTDA
ncbi:MAG: DNA methyltransferase [Gammaproteobacteria bacterium]